MSKLPTLKKILREDVKDAPAWIGAIIEPFNSLAEFVYQAMNKSITDQDNIQCFIKDLSYKTLSTYPAVQNVVQFNNDLKVKATGCVLLQAYDIANYTPAPGPTWVPWVENNGVIMVSTVTGLEANKTYLLRLKVT